MRLALATLLAFVLVVAVAVGFPPLEITGKSDTTITLGGLHCGKKYKVQVSERNSGEWTDARTKKRETGPCPTEPPPPACNLNATPSNFGAQVAAATTGQTICLSAGNYGTFTGTNKAITIRGIPGSLMRYSFGAGDSGFTLDGLQGMGGTISSGASNITVRNSVFSTDALFEDLVNSNVSSDHNTHIGINSLSGSPDGRIKL